MISVHLLLDLTSQAHIPLAWRVVDLCLLQEFTCPIADNDIVNLRFMAVLGVELLLGIGNELTIEVVAYQVDGAATDSLLSSLSSSFGISTYLCSVLSGFHGFRMVATL